MSEKFRYMLIVLGVIVFVVSAPLIVFFVRGVKYDFKEKKFVSTGILALKSEPKDLDIYLDGALAKNSSGEIRFLQPKNYLVTLKKDGYLNWEKTLAVLPDKVVWISPENGKIHLLLKDQRPISLRQGIVDFHFWPGGLIAITAKELLVSEISDLKTAEKFSLPKETSKILASANHKYFLLSKEAAAGSPSHVFWFDLAKKKLLDLETMFETTSLPLPIFDLGPEGELFALMEDNLYRINVENSSKQLLLSKISGFKILGKTLYYLVKQEQGPALMARDMETGEASELLKGLPDFKTAAIIVNSQKRIFIVAENSIYSVQATGLFKLAENLMEWSMEETDENLSYAAAGELWYADAVGNTNFITRTSENLKLPEVRKNFGYALYVENEKIKALELDRRDRQNAYELFSGKIIQKYKLDEESRQLLILDDGVLKLLKIR